jgi:hypothetical protein
MRSVLLWAGSALVLAGCGAVPVVRPEPVVRTVTVEVEVPTKCISEMPARPDMQAPQEIARMPSGRGVGALGTGYVLLWDYTARLEAVTLPCVAPRL